VAIASKSTWSRCRQRTSLEVPEVVHRGFSTTDLPQPVLLG
jgi:hypothetical protein